LDGDVASYRAIATADSYTSTTAGACASLSRAYLAVCNDDVACHSAASTGASYAGATPATCIYTASGNGSNLAVLDDDVTCDGRTCAAVTDTGRAV
jgi:hypothetical protein